MPGLKFMFLFSTLIFFVACAPKHTESPSPVNIKEILKTTTSWDGNSIVYPEGSPEITALTIDMPEGFNTGFHCHPVPNLAYMLEGEIEVEVFDGPKIIFKEGDAFEEVIHSWHRGKVIKGPAKILVFYVGEVDTPITIKPKSDDLNNEMCVE